MDQDGLANMALCEECGQNAANVHVTQITNNQTSVFRLCEGCAQKKGISITVGEAPQPGTEGEQKPVEDILCATCRTRFSEFKEKGFLGCSNCYEAFSAEVDKFLSQVHGSNVHKGKRYIRRKTGLRGKPSLKQLRADLEEAIRNEAFELAAQLRDSISALVAKEEKR
jgi:protein arginine kinase activator